MPGQPRNRDNSDQPGAGFTKEASRHRPGTPAPRGLHHISREVSVWEHSAAAGFLMAKRMQARIAHTQLHNDFFLRQPVGLVEI